MRAERLQARSHHQVSQPESTLHVDDWHPGDILAIRLRPGASNVDIHHITQSTGDNSVVGTFGVAALRLGGQGGKNLGTGNGGGLWVNRMARLGTARGTRGLVHAHNLHPLDPLQ